MLHNWIVLIICVVIGVLAPTTESTISGETFKRVWLGGVITVTKTSDEAGSLLKCLARCLIDTNCDFVRYDKVVGPACDFIEPSTLHHVGPDEDGEQIYARINYAGKLSINLCAIYVFFHRS